MHPAPSVRCLWMALAVLTGCVRTVGLGEECGVAQEGDGRFEPPPQCDDGLVCSWLSNSCVCPDGLIAVGDSCRPEGTGQLGDACPAGRDAYCAEGLRCPLPAELGGRTTCQPPGSVGEGESCRDDSDCAESLICDSEQPWVCVQPESIPEFYPCRQDGACREGLSCRTGPGGRLCRSPGQVGEDCDDDVDCELPLACVEQACVL